MWKLLFVLASAIGVYGSPPYGYGGFGSPYGSPYGRGGFRRISAQAWNPYGAGGYNTRYNYGYNGYGGQTSAYAPSTTTWDRYGSVTTTTRWNPYGPGGYNTRYNYGGQTSAYARSTTTWDKYGSMGGWNPYGAGGYNTRYNYVPQVSTTTRWNPYGAGGYNTRYNYGIIMPSTTTRWNPYGAGGYNTRYNYGIIMPSAYATSTAIIWDRFGSMGGWNPYGAGGYNTRYNYGIITTQAPSSAWGGYTATPASMIFPTSRRVIRPAPGGGLRIGASYSTDVVALPPVSVQIWPATVIPPPPASNGGACGGIIKLPSKGVKYIQSPNYPKDYPRRSDCVFSIIAPKGKSIQLQFVAMSIEKHARCVWDFIEIFKGGRNGKNITKLCSMKLRTYKIAGGRATVYFHSDGSVQKKGFKIKMSVV